MTKFIKTDNVTIADIIRTRQQVTFLETETTVEMLLPKEEFCSILKWELYEKALKHSEAIGKELIVRIPHILSGLTL